MDVDCQWILLYSKRIVVRLIEQGYSLGIGGRDRNGEFLLGVDRPTYMFRSGSLHADLVLCWYVYRFTLKWFYKHTTLYIYDDDGFTSTPKTISIKIYYLFYE